MAPREGPKCPVACNFCRLKKIKCDGGRPCSNCIDHHENCVFPAINQRRRKKSNEATRALEERLGRMESLFHATIAAQSPRTGTGVRLDDVDMVDGPTFQTPLNLQTPKNTQAPVDPQTSVTLEDNPVDPQALGVLESSSSVDPLTDTLSSGQSNGPSILDQVCDDVVIPLAQTEHDALSQGQTAHVDGMNGLSSAPTATKEATDAAVATQAPLPTPNSSIEEENVVSPQISNSEHHGPVSYLSICSDPAMRWISERASAPEFFSSASAFSLTTTRTLKMDRRLSSVRAAEPNLETSWFYANAYFQSSLEHVFGVVNRQAFEKKLQAHLSSPTLDEDPAWYALRNAIYAAGSKAHISCQSRPESFEQAQSESWKYFENALSVHTELIYMRSGLMAVQALMVMAFFTEGLGAPALEYMLVSNAVRLAQSKGLHRRPVESWSMPKSDIQSRCCLFWVMYAYEKHIAFRSGRPSAIDDDDISCPLPTSAVEGSTMDFEFVIEVIKHAQIQSRIAKDLSSVKSSKEPPEVLAQRVHELECRLSQWHQNMPASLRAGIPVDFSSLSPQHHLYHNTFLHFAYHGSLISTHSIFANPWHVQSYGQDRGPVFNEQVAASAKAVVEASRQIILATKYIDVRGSWPAWLTFFYPLLGLINIFIYVLKYPTLPSTASDMALMDTVAGHFGYLEYYSSSKLSVPFIGELTRIARATVEKAKARELGVSVDTRSNSMRPNMKAHSDLHGFSSASQHGDLESLDFILEDWPSFVPSPSQVTSLALDSFLVDDVI